MINILLEGYDIEAPWLFEELKKHIKPMHKVAVVAFSFRDSRVKSLADWDALYSKELAGGLIIVFAKSILTAIAPGVFT